MFTFNLRRIGILLVLVLVLIPAAAVASHQFADVPSSSIFHNDIAWMADNGITKGCNPPANTLFCPEDFVKRQQMAAFMHRGQLRLGTRFAGRFVTKVGLPENANTLVAATNMTAPGNGGAITVTGSAIIEELSTTRFASGLLWAEIDNGGRCSRDNFITIAVFWATGSLLDANVTTGALAVPAGQHRIDLCIWSTGGPARAVAAEVDVTWIAAGANGGDVTPFSGTTRSESLSDYFNELEASIVAEAEAG
jgi:hypothetical protein